LIDSHRVNVNPTGVNNMTSFHIAAKYGQINLCKWLYIRSGDITARTADGFAPIHLAALHHHFDVVDFLMKVGANPADFFSTGKLLFVEAVSNLGEQLPLAEFLLSRNVSQSADGRGTFPIHAASRHRNLDILQGLISQGANMNERDKKGYRPLHHAVERNLVDVCTYLLENSADTEGVDNRWRTPLHHAAALGYIDCVELLCDYGANACAYDVDGSTPTDLAYRHNRSAVIAYFESLGLMANDCEEEEEVLPLRKPSGRVSIRGDFPPRKGRR
jgi:ankyrin repeat protein